MARATDATFDALHALFAESLGEELKRALEAARQPRTIKKKDKDGKEVDADNPAYAPLSPQFLNQVRGFLKDNGVDAPARSERVGGLAQALQDLEDADLMVDRHVN